MNALVPIEDQLKPAAGAEIAEQLHLLFSAMPMQAGSDPKTALTGYLIALQNRPLWAIEEAVKRFLRGEVAGASKKFCPRPPELAEIVADVLSPIVMAREADAKQEAEQRRKQEQVAQRTVEFSDEHRAKMKFMFAVLAKGLALQEADRVARASAFGIGTKRGIEEMMALGQEWSIPIPETMWSSVS